MIRKIVSIIILTLLIFCIVLIKAFTRIESDLEIDLFKAERSIVADELLKKAKEIMRENYEDIEISDNINIYIANIPFGIDGLTQYTNGTNGVATIYMSDRILSMSHDTSIHRVLHELIHAISRDFMFEENFKEGLVDLIARNLCVENKYHVDFIGAYEIESKVAKQYIQKYGQEFYKKYLQRDWRYFEDLGDKELINQFAYSI